MILVADESGHLPLPWLAAPIERALMSKAHALLVVAGAGVGALAFQMTLAQAWLCEGASTSPCGHCASCRLVRAGTHPDLLRLLPESLRLELGAPPLEDSGDGGSKRKPSRQIRIGDVRAATDWIATTTSRGRAKVLVLHPGEALNAHAANALLKTLEEPPTGARLLLSCADVEHLLPTVRSRCQRLELPVPPKQVARDWLAAQDVVDAEVLLAACSGRPLDALAMARAGIDAATWTALPRAIAAGRADALTAWPLARAIDAMQKLCHDALVVGVGGGARYFAAAALPAGADVARLIEWGGALAAAARIEDHPTNDALQIEALVLKARAAWSPVEPRVATLRP